MVSLSARVTPILVLPVIGLSWDVAAAQADLHVRECTAAVLRGNVSASAMQVVVPQKTNVSRGGAYVPAVRLARELIMSVPMADAFVLKIAPALGIQTSAATVSASAV